MKRRALSGYVPIALCLSFVLLATHCDSVEPDPTLAVSTQRLEFEEDEMRLDFTITNEGGRTLEWSINVDQNWIDVTPNSGETTDGASQATVTVDRDGLPPGDHTGTLNITSNGGSSTVRVFMTVPEMPMVEITSPTSGQQIEVSILAETGSGSFSVGGTSEGVSSNNALRVYVLVHPTDPFSPEWGIYPADPDREGRWTTTAWYGGATFPPQPGKRFDILAVVAEIEHVGNLQTTDTPSRLNPTAESATVSVSIGSIR